MPGVPHPVRINALMASIGSSFISAKIVAIFFAIKDRRFPGGPLADPGVRYSRTGLVESARTQKGWGDHRGV